MSNEPIDRFITRGQATGLLVCIPLISPPSCAEKMALPRFWHALRALASARLTLDDDPSMVIEILHAMVVSRWLELPQAETALVAHMLGLPAVDPVTSWVVDHLPCHE